ncbi:MAG: von Willebrand factor type protein, partial [Rhizobium sp.]|nr:von Willebrand factor type protein [Rhizobium sp.]
MAYNDIRTHIRLDASYTAAEKRQIAMAVKHAYEHSPSAKAMFDLLLAGDTDIKINNVNDFSANRASNKLNIGMNYLDDIYMIDNHGKAVRVGFEIALLHEFSHVLNDVTDPTDAQIAAHDYVGDNVRFENIFRSELGLGPRSSYYNLFTDNNYAALPPAFTKGYTNGNEIDITLISNAKFQNIDTTDKGSQRDLLIGGKVADNVFVTGDGRDYLYGFKGNDTLNGG